MQPFQPPAQRSNSLILWLLLLLKFSLPFLISSSVYELHRDEYLYYAQGQHLDVGYLENPPLIGLLGAISGLFGGSMFLIKLWPALFGVLTLWITWKMVDEYGGGFYAKLLAALGIIFSAYLRIHYLFQPNFLDIFFWTLSAYFLACFCNRRNERYLIALSMALALGWWSKYSILFFILAIVLSLLLTPYRTLFLKKMFWQAVLTFLLLILPNILWQYTHHFPLIHHMSELRETQLKYLDRGSFLKEQLLMLFPVCFIWIAGLVWLLGNNRFRVIGLTYLFSIFLLMLGSGKGYYALGAYPMLLAAGGVSLQRLTLHKRVPQLSIVIIVVLLSFPLIYLLLPIQPPAAMAASNKKYGLKKLGLLKWEDQEDHLLQQDFADMLGWKELTQKSETYFKRLPDSTQANTIVYCRNYGLGGALSYYGKDTLFKQKVISDNGTHLLWIPDHLYFKNLLFIGEEMPHSDDAVFQHFQKFTVIDSCNNPYSRQYGIKIIYFENASDSSWKLAQKGLAEKKAVFGR